MERTNISKIVLITEPPCEKKTLFSVSSLEEKFSKKISLPGAPSPAVFHRFSQITIQTFELGDPDQLPAVPPPCCATSPSAEPRAASQGPQVAHLQEVLKSDP